MIYMEEQSILLRKIQLNVSASLLLSIMLLRYYISRLELFIGRWLVKECDLHAYLKAIDAHDITGFLIEQGMYSEAIEHLEEKTKIGFLWTGDHSRGESCPPKIPVRYLLQERL